MASCGWLSSKFLQPGRFGILKGGGLSVTIGGSGRGIILCSVSEQSERNAPVRRIAAEDNPFVKPLSNTYFVVPCRFCQGSGEVKCDICNGQGNLARGGFHKKNPVAIARIVVGSKWTAMESTFGWRHFHVHTKRRGPGKDWFLEMVSTCDETTRFWLNAKILKCSGVTLLQRGDPGSRTLECRLAPEGRASGHSRGRGSENSNHLQSVQRLSNEALSHVRKI